MWVRKKYQKRIDGQNRFGMFIKDKEGNSTPIYVRCHEETQAEDWVKVRGEASPYDGNLLYWAKRLKQHPLANSDKAKLLKIQRWQCPRCGLYFKDGDVLEIDHSIPTALGGKDTLNNKFVYHRHCHDEKTAEDMALIARTKAAGVTHN
jgi:RNA-directed DNA polymerase